uniref:Uncharacterized protein n=1 Tax=Ditylenchus dipsaci TaxID=166011 RepID=A0A915DC16_9BILA
MLPGSTSLSLDSTCSISNDPCPSSELAASTITSAEFKRQKYKSLFTQRRPSKGTGPTSEYTQYGHAATNSQHLASSLDSSRSENSGHDWRDQQQKSVDMSNFTRKPESYSATKSNSSKTLSPTPIDPFSSSHRFPIQQQHTTHPATSQEEVTGQLLAEAILVIRGTTV